MEHFQHSLCNDVLKADPADKEAGRVADLHIFRGVREFSDCKMHVVESFWKPDPEELLALLNGGCVILSCFALTAPPVMLMVTPTL